MSLAFRIAAGLPRLAACALAVTVTLATPSQIACADTPVAAPSAETQALIARLGLEESATPVRERKGWARPKAVLVANVSPEMLASLREVAPGVKLTACTTGASRTSRRGGGSIWRHSA